jgi:ribonuclease Y
MGLMEFALIAAVGVLVAALVFMAVYLLNMRAKAREFEAQKKDAERRLAEARREADEMVKDALREAKDLAVRESREHEKFQREKTLEIQKIEKALKKREETFEKKQQTLDQKEKELAKHKELVEREEKRAAEALKSAEKSLVESQEKLESIARLSIDDARELLKQSIESEVRATTASEVRQIEEEARRTAEERARSIIATSIQRIANEFVTDACVSVVSLPADDMKGRIIGREGRNIRAIEQSTGVDLIIDDTPEAIIISCFNPIRREIAKVAIERLVQDGRIHPARIDEVVQKVTTEFDQMIREAGERASFECGIEGMTPELVVALGKLKYRTAGGQSVLQHSVETAQIAGVIAAELDLNVRLAKRAGLLHDIGKALDEETEGHHASVGAQFAQKLGEPPEVVEAIAKHHMEHAQSVNPITVVVQIANQLSTYRPGARKDFLEKAIGRLKDMETLVAEIPGVDQAYVIRSGREVRAMVAPTVMEDEAVSVLARSVAKRIRSDLNYPGQVKVTMVREQRVTSIAK